MTMRSIFAAALLAAATWSTACERARPAAEAGGAGAAPSAHAAQPEGAGEGAPEQARDRAPAPVGPPAGPPVVRLLGALRAPTDLATDGRAVYVADGAEGGRLLRLDLRTGALDVLAAGEAGVGVLAVDDDRLYWTRTEGEVTRVRAIDRPGEEAPGEPRTLTEVAGRVTDLDASAGVLVLTVAAGEAPWWRAPKAGGPATALGGPRGGVAGMAAAFDDRVYGVHAPKAGGTATLWSLPAGGGGGHALAIGPWAADGTAVVADRTHVYVLHPGGVDEVPREGGAPRALAVGRAAGARVAHDAASLFVVVAGDAGAAFPARVPKGGGGTVALAAPGVGARAVAVRHGLVFWLTGGEDGGVWTSPRVLEVAAEVEPATGPEGARGEEAARAPHDP